MLYRWERECPDKIFLRQRLDGTWKDYTWKQATHEARQMATYLKAQGFAPGSHIAILSKNCAHWILADLAIWMAGYASVPLYPNLAASTISQILTHSESKFIFVGKLDGWAAMKPGVPADLPAIAFPYHCADELKNWDSVLKSVPPLAESPTRAHNEIATVIYTSGTTGQPKGVVHNFRAIAKAGFEITREVQLTHDESFFSYLPLAHVAERLLTETLSLYTGGTVAFAESLETFAENLREIQPTVFLGVPRIWTKFQGGILQKLPQKKLDRLLSIPILSGFIRNKLKRALGLSRCRFAVTGAAPIPKATLEWFQKLGILLQEAYGMTENFAYSHLNRKATAKFGTVGQPWAGVEAKIGPNQETLVKSECTMVGYFKEEALTQETVRDGFLHTGDQGEIDQAGFLKITGRVKDLFKTSKGKYVAPTPIEMRIAGSSLIEQACLVGANLPQPMALVVLSEPGKKLEHKSLRAELESMVKQINETLDPHERIAKIVVTKEVWSVDNGFLTPTLKVKRNVIEKCYEPNLEGWLSVRETVIQQV